MHSDFFGNRAYAQYLFLENFLQNIFFLQKSTIFVILFSRNIIFLKKS